MELRQLEHFVAVAKHLSFSRAARDVHVVQSSLSTSVQRLERELGGPLFERTSRRVALTPAGQALLPRAQSVLLELETAKRAVAACTGTLRGQVSLGTIQMLTWVDLPTVLGRFQRSNPGVEVTLYQGRVEELLDKLLAGELDMTFVARDQSRLPAGTTVLATDEEALVVVVAPEHPLARQQQVLLEDLQPQTFIEFEAGAGLQKVVQRLCAEAELDRRILVRVTELELLIPLVDAGLGISILPEGLAQRTELAMVPIGPTVPRRSVALVARESEPTNRAAAALLLELQRHGA